MKQLLIFDSRKKMKRPNMRLKIKIITLALTKVDVISKEVTVGGIYFISVRVF